LASLAREKAKEQWLDEGYVHFTAQRFKEAVTACSFALELDSTYALAFYYRGYVYYHLKEYQKALADFDYALALNSSNAIAYYNRGNVYRDLKRYHQAIQDYDHALELEPNLSDARASRGVSIDERMSRMEDKSCLSLPFMLQYTRPSR
jgi:tetratricopeptide (TPR) repeat protein